MVRTEPIEEETGMMVVVVKESLPRRRGVNIERESITRAKAGGRVERWGLEQIWI